MSSQWNEIAVVEFASWESRQVENVEWNEAFVNLL